MCKVFSGRVNPTALFHCPKGMTVFPITALTFPKATTAFRREITGFLRGVLTFRQGPDAFRPSIGTCRAGTTVSPAAPMSFLRTILPFRTPIQTRNL